MEGGSWDIISLGIEFGIARAVGAIVFSVVIGLGMHFLFREEEAEKMRARAAAIRAQT